MRKQISSGYIKNVIWITITMAILIVIAGVLGFHLINSPDSKIAEVKQRGNEYLLRENYGKAKEEFLKAIKIQPEELINYFQLAQALEGLKDYEGEAYYLKKALNIAETKENLRENLEEYVSLCIKLAECYYKNGDILERIDVLKYGYQLTKSERLELLLQDYYPDRIRSDKDDGEYLVEQFLEVNLVGAPMIYYTLDSTDPTLNSKVYHGPLILPEGTYDIRARAYNEFGFSSEVSSFTFIVENNSTTSEEDISKDEQENIEGEEMEESEENLYQAQTDEKGNIIWVDPNIEFAVRELLHKEEEPITKEEAAAYTGSIDLSGTNINRLDDLVWLEKLSVLICKGKDLVDADFINKLQLDRVIAVYKTMEDVNKVKNTDELKEINHLGICVSDFSLGNMTIIEMLEFYSRMNQLMVEITNLEYLDLSNNGLKDFNLIGDIKNINNVKVLILKNNELKDISKLRSFQNLIYLDVTNNKITNYSPVQHVKTIIGK